MPRAEDAYLHAAGVHDSAAAVHDRAAEFFEEHGKPELALRERARATADRDGAAADRRRAQLRHEQIAAPPVRTQ